MHGGEYDGPIIEREVKRIASWANAAKQQEHAVLHNDDAEEKNENPKQKQRNGSVGSSKPLTFLP